MPFNQGGMQGGFNQGGMEGGMFGPPGGLQNLGGQVMSDQELQALMGMLQSQPRRGGSDMATLPIYDTPAPGGIPQGTPSLGTTGIDPSMMATPADGGLQGMDFGPQGEMKGMQQNLMNVGMQRMLEEERLKKLLAMGGGSAMGGGGYMNTPGMQGPRLPSGGV